MNKNKKWGIELTTEKPIYVVLFVSRNKDNPDVNNFKQRRNSFITTRTPEELMPEFETFVKKGVPREASRFYYSVNRRDPREIVRQLTHFLIDNPEMNPVTIDAKLAGIAATKECALEKKWMFDFDSTDPDMLVEFINDIKNIDNTLEIEINQTPNGYHVIVNHGFDIRTISEKYKGIAEVKKDDLKLVKVRINEGAI